MKQPLLALAKPSLMLFAMSLIGIGYSIIQLHPASADASTSSRIVDTLCSGTDVPVSNDLYGCGYPDYPIPRYSSLEVSIIAIVATILIVYAVWFASKKYFATYNKGSNHPIAYATIFGFVLLVAATILMDSHIPSVWSDNGWFSKPSAEVLATLVFVPSLAVFVACLIKTGQHKQRRLWILQLALIVGAICLAFISIVHVTGSYTAQGL